MRYTYPLFFLILGTGAFAQDLPPLEAYGKLPMYDMFEMSPSGKLAASRYTTDTVDSVVVLDADTGELLTGADAAKVNPRSLTFAYEDKLILVAGETVRPVAVRSGFDFSAAYLVDVNADNTRLLLTGEKSLWPYQSGIGQIIGTSPEAPIAYMPAFTGSSFPVLGVYEVRLDNRRPKLIARGNVNTIDWFVNAQGDIFIREDFDDEKNVHRIFAIDGRARDGETLLYEEATVIRSYVPVGVTQSRNALVMLSRSSEAGGVAYFLMSLEDGSIAGPIFAKEGVEIARVITDVNRVVYGVEYAGFVPTYAFFDESTSERVNTVQSRLSGVSARLVGWSREFSRMIFELSGGWTAGAYLMFEDVNGQPKMLGATRPLIEKEFIAPVEITEYEARDNLKIPALVTAMQGVRDKGNAPTIVLPHGGPASHDDYGFDWLAQYFASRGYVVLQPQFRGSTGFGHDHRVAGDGEWGGKMQTDIDDGVRHLIDAGITDPSRVCIVGGSYGGYAALAAGAFSPEMYQCVVSLAGVSDISLMLKKARNDRGRDDWVIDYWEKFYGAEASEKESLNAISPARHAELFRAPVLLLHGKDDTIVDIEQSRTMEKALRKAGKDVELVKLKGEDHWLTQEATRTEALRAMAAFIEKHL